MVTTDSPPDDEENEHQLSLLNEDEQLIHGLDCNQFGEDFEEEEKRDDYEKNN